MSNNHLIRKTDGHLLRKTNGHLVNGLGSPLITTTVLPAGTAGTAYSFHMLATGGTQPYVWSASGTAPPGLSISSSGVISGTPTSPGWNNGWTIRCTGANALYDQISAPIFIDGGSQKLSIVCNWTQIGTGCLILYVYSPGPTDQAYHQATTGNSLSPPYYELNQVDDYGGVMIATGNNGYADTWPPETFYYPSVSMHPSGIYTFYLYLRGSSNIPYTLQVKLGTTVIWQSAANAVMTIAAGRQSYIQNYNSSTNVVY